MIYMLLRRTTLTWSSHNPTVKSYVLNCSDKFTECLFNMAVRMWRHCCIQVSNYSLNIGIIVSVHNDKLNAVSWRAYCIQCCIYLQLTCGMINLVKIDLFSCLVLDIIVESSHNCVCLGKVYGVIGKIQIMSGISKCIFISVVLHFIGSKGGCWSTGKIKHCL